MWVKIRAAHKEVSVVMSLVEATAMNAPEDIHSSNAVTSQMASESRRALYMGRKPPLRCKQQAFENSPKQHPIHNFTDLFQLFSILLVLSILFHLVLGTTCIT